MAVQYMRANQRHFNVKFLLMCQHTVLLGLDNVDCLVLNEMTGSLTAASEF